jgi:hypothetical protein
MFHDFSWRNSWVFARLQRFWSLLLGPHGASTGAARLGAKLLGTYAQLAVPWQHLESWMPGAPGREKIGLMGFNGDLMELKGV